ncbi:MAG: protein kinase domain-containing protein [Planctomycetota bacterium]|jgi:serine/threonine-protein kinase
METHEVDKAFGEAAVARGLLTEGQLEECLRAAQLVTQAGLEKPLAEIMMEKGFITQIQAEQIGRAVDSPDAKTIAGFELLEKLGEGGMGVVYKAHQASMDRLVALKVLPERLANDKQFVSRFFREARVAAKLDHPNIVRGIDVGSSGSDYFFVMEYVEGEDVGNILKERGKLPEKEALEIVVQVARALDHAQEHDMIHRDIKPDNVLLTPDGVAKLLDLGLARSTSGDMTRMTVTGTAMGTPHYISPEQARGEADIDIRTDVYSLGVSLYHMLVGTPPFDGETVAVIITKTLTEQAPPVHEIVPEVSEATSRVVEKMMSKEKGSRYANPAEVVADLELILSGEEPTRVLGASRPGSRPSPAPAPRSPSGTTPTTTPDSGQMRMMSDADIAKLKAETAAEVARAAGGGKLVPLLIAFVAIIVVGAIATPFVLKELRREPPPPVAPAEDAEAKFAAARKAAEEAEARRKLEEEAADDDLWAKTKAAAERMAADGNHAGAIAAVDLFSTSAKTTKYNMQVIELRGGFEKQRAEALEAQRKAERAAREAEREKIAAATSASAAEKAARLVKLATLAEKGGDFEDALELLSEGEGLGADVTAKVARVRRGRARAAAIAGAKELMGRAAWKDAVAAIETLLKEYPGDEEATALLATAKKGLGPAPKLALDLGRGVSLELIYVKPGRFLMGSAEGWGDEKPVHEVVLTKGFYIGKYEVTQAQFKQMMGVDRSTFKGERNPVEEVSWDEADDFCKRVGERVGKTVRLPTEAEWEYAARAGTAGNYCFGNDEAELGQYGWYAVNSGKKTHPVGGKQPNAWGIHDMHGNVWEWIADWYDKNYYTKTPREDPAGPTRPTGRRVLRGGCMDNKASGCTATERSSSRPTSRDNDAGFRVVVEP